MFPYEAAMWAAVFGATYTAERVHHAPEHAHELAVARANEAINVWRKQMGADLIHPTRMPF